MTHTHHADMGPCAQCEAPTSRTLNVVAVGTPAPLPEHVARGYVVTESGCWLWQRSKSRDGYGWASLKNRTKQAHRLVYELIKGPVPDGLVLDHLCRVRHCVNPDHLEPVTPGENVRRSELTTAGATVCAKCGGPFSRLRGQRRCLPCLALYEAGRREKKKLAERQRRARLRSALGQAGSDA